MERKKDSGLPITATTLENKEVLEKMICSQEEPGTHVCPKNVSQDLKVSHSSIRRMIKTKRH